MLKKITDMSIDELGVLALEMAEALRQRQAQGQLSPRANSNCNIAGEDLITAGELLREAFGL